MKLEAPSIEYFQLSPVLIILGMAVAGVLVEAFLPRSARYGAQLVLAIGGQLAALAAVILTGRIFASILERFGQPPVIGEVLAGIALGPSLLGWISHAWFGMATSPLMPPSSTRSPIR